MGGLFALGLGKAAGYGFGGPFVDPDPATAPDVSYPAALYDWPKDVAIAAVDPAVNAGTVTSFAVQAGALPTGVTLSASSGRLTGTPTVAGQGSVTIRATGPGGTDDSVVGWSVGAPSIAYAGTPYTWVVLVPLAGVSPTNTGGRAMAYALVAGVLPTGVVLNAATGALTGTPTVVLQTGTVTIRATGPLGTSDTSVDYTIAAA